jgi:hypothetical protein
LLFATLQATSSLRCQTAWGKHRYLIVSYLTYFPSIHNSHGGQIGACLAPDRLLGESTHCQYGLHLPGPGSTSVIPFFAIPLKQELPEWEAHRPSSADGEKSRKIKETETIKTIKIDKTIHARETNTKHADADSTAGHETSWGLIPIPFLVLSIFFFPLTYLHLIVLQD